MRLWHLSPSVNSIFKHTCAAIHWGYTSDIWSDPSSTSKRYVCQQRRLWRDCASRSLARAFAVRLCDKYHNLMSWLVWCAIAEQFEYSYIWQWLYKTVSATCLPVTFLARFYIEKKLYNRDMSKAFVSL